MTITVTLDAVDTAQEDMSFVGIEIEDAAVNRVADTLIRTAEEFLATEGREMRLRSSELGVNLDFTCAEDEILNLFEALGAALEPYRTDV